MLRDRPAGTLVRSSKTRAMFAMRACRKSTMVGEPLNAKQMTTVSPVSSPRHGSFRNVVHVLTDQLDYSTHGNDGTTMELSAWPADDEAFVRCGHAGEEGMETCGLDNVQSVLVLWFLHYFTPVCCI